MKQTLPVMPMTRHYMLQVISIENVINSLENDSIKPFK